MWVSDSLSLQLVKEVQKLSYPFLHQDKSGQTENQSLFLETSENGGHRANWLSGVKEHPSSTWGMALISLFWRGDCYGKSSGIISQC